MTFKGIITASHAGQMTGNGGLIKIKITSMTFNGKTVQVEGKITKARLLFWTAARIRVFTAAVCGQEFTDCSFFYLQQMMESRIIRIVSD